MLEGFANAPRVPELRKRLLFTAAALAIYRLGVAIPTPGIDGAALAEFFRQMRNNFFGMVNTYWSITGGQRPICFTELGYLTSEGYGPLPDFFAWAASIGSGNALAAGPRERAAA